MKSLEEISDEEGELTQCEGKQLTSLLGKAELFLLGTDYRRGAITADFLQAQALVGTRAALVAGVKCDS